VWVLGGTSTPSPSAAATNTPEPTIEPQRQVPRQPRVTRQASLPSAPARARISEVTSAPPRPQWAQEIQTLTDAADRGSEAAVALLGDIIATEADAAVRRQAVAALGRLTGVEVEPVLLAALGDAEAAVRLRAVRGLRTAGSDTAAQSLAAVVVGDP